MEKELRFAPQSEEERRDDNPHYVDNFNESHPKPKTKKKLELIPDQDKINKAGLAAMRDVLRKMDKDKK